MTQEQIKAEAAITAVAQAEVKRLRKAIQAALERLDTSLFTNAEHQQAKDILIAALGQKVGDR